MTGVCRHPKTLLSVMVVVGFAEKASSLCVHVLILKAMRLKARSVSYQRRILSRVSGIFDLTDVRMVNGGARRPFEGIT